VFGLFRRWRRRRITRRPFPQPWIGHLEKQVPFFARIEGDDRKRFLDYVHIFVREKHFIAAGGFEMTDEARVVIAASAVRLVLHLGLSAYDRLTEIVVYPSHYHHPDNDEAVVFGEAHQWGVVVLSWDAVLHGLGNPRDGHDTAAHEFAHVLDRADGTYDGTPELRARGDYQPWAEVMSRHYQALRDRRRPERKVLRDYGAINEAEFFAVATESFFERPERMKAETPELYDELARFYGFDPAAD
jgi:MtfA peptidase